MGGESVDGLVGFDGEFGGIAKVAIEGFSGCFAAAFVAIVDGGDGHGGADD